ncbi:DUF1877 family protein [Streptomyces sp. ISL-98]|uniref:DUF1877 family protein n=1 Tax=Streptomyces sp. ISL-98 TaxID=2819192 RepID=UPI001BE75D38|nr:DUF1877 family protein [Streptomyces sp. ISL-98]MBT2507243.1 DUF1877 family protein [Streptomyces sp. ISL-98]
MSDNPDHLRALFADDWDIVRARCRTATEAVLNKDYLDVERLYSGAPARPGPPGPEELPVLGGRPVPYPDHQLPPFVVLTPPQVAAAAAYLATVSFDALWQAGREDLTKLYGQPYDASEVRDHFAGCHSELRAFYARAADEGRAVVKWLLV